MLRRVFVVTLGSNEVAALGGARSGCPALSFTLRMNSQRLPRAEPQLQREPVGEEAAGVDVASGTPGVGAHGDERVPLGVGCSGLLQGWTAHWSTRKPNRLFYHNAETGESKWKLPRSSSAANQSLPQLPPDLSLPQLPLDLCSTSAVHPWYFFHVDVLRSGKELGLRLEPGSRPLKIVEVLSASAMQDWNHRCALTFPRDQVRPGDKIICVNHQPDFATMEYALDTDERIFMVVWRTEIQ